MSADADTWDDLSFVVSSVYRQTVLLPLDNGPATPSTIAEVSDRPISHISRALGDLRDEGLVELLVSEERKKGRIYGLSDRGEEVAEDEHGILDGGAA